MGLVKCPGCGRTVIDDTGICKHCDCKLENYDELHRPHPLDVYKQNAPAKKEPVEIVKLVEAPRNEARCPHCGSTSIQGMKKGFGLGKAAVGAVLLGPVGLLGGVIGSNKVVRVCLNCGHQW